MAKSQRDSATGLADEPEDIDMFLVVLYAHYIESL